MQRALPVDSEVGSNGVITESSGGEGSLRKKLLRGILVIVLIVVAVSGFFAAAYTFHFFGLGTTNCWARPTNVPTSSAYFVVVMANEGMNVGFNGSKFQSVSWPVMNVTLGTTVTIHVINKGTVESHGFAIQRYFSGFAFGPGTCGHVTFTADQLGSFTVYCNISCSIHVFMQDGKVNVNP